jgi:hypothetical protein
VGFFSRAKGDGGQFWHARPLRTSDPAVLYQHGIRCISAGDGPGMMATGWAILETGGLESHQAPDFLRDGFRQWQRSDTFDPRLAVDFLTELLTRLDDDPSVPWPNLYEVSPELVQPRAVHYSLRCWAASELLETVDAQERARIEPQAYDAIVRSRIEFVPARSADWARRYAAEHALSPPWA